MAVAWFVIDVSSRQVDIPIGAYRHTEPSPNFMQNVIAAYNDADIPARAELLMRYAASWPRVCVLLGDHNNETKCKSRKRFMQDLDRARLKRARLAGPLAGPASDAPAVIVLPDMVRPLMPEPDAEPVAAANGCRCFLCIGT